ncbi:hypothetical protein SAMD00019534_107780, partial [Acytostelium subglobosum LB1]|uniref:hypothetical protein n=1 Tax=Acytostelium subglobosum LB1 TaxID=1410327 RepID=UPI000644BD9F
DDQDTLKVFEDVQVRLDDLESLLIKHNKIQQQQQTTTTTEEQRQKRKKLAIGHQIELLMNDLQQRVLDMERLFKGAPIMLHTKFAGRLPHSFGHLMTKPVLLDIVQQLLDTSDISGHPEWNLRVKTPNNKSFDVPWHQDAAYLSEGAEKLDQITCWIPLVNITKENGPLVMIRQQPDQPLYTHTLQRLRGTDDLKDSWYLEILESELPADRQVVETVGLRRGSVVLFKNSTVHQSLPNMSNSVRWTVDFRFQKTSDPSGFNPIDVDQVKVKMSLRSASQRAVPIDYAHWSGNKDILMTNNSSGDNNTTTTTEGEIDYHIEGPWFDRWTRDTNISSSSP